MFADAQVSYLRALFVVGLFVATSFTAASAGPASPSQPTLPAQKARVVGTYGRLPLSFEDNTGQAEKSVKFLSRGGGYGLYLTGNEAVLTLCQTAFGAARPDFRRTPDLLPKSAECDVVRMQLAGASLKTEPAGEDRLAGRVNYFIGSDPSKWRTSIPTYAKVRYSDIYPGIDLVYYGNQRQLEFDFLVAPHADPNAIRLRFSGPNRLRLAANGDLILSTAGGSLTFRKPSIYQAANGRRVQSAGEFVLLAKNTVGLRLGRYDRDRALVIDPALVYSTFLGGSVDPNSSALFGGFPNAIAVDAVGNAYVTGQALSTSFPVTTGAFQTTDPGAATQGYPAFVTKLNASGTALIYSTYLGGSAFDQGNAIAVDAAGDAYVAGATSSTDFPVTPGAFQTSNNGAAHGGNSSFITQLNATGTALVYSTYLGGSAGNTAYAIALDTTGDTYVAGQTSSTDFPVTPGALQVQNNAAGLPKGFEFNAFVTKLNPAGAALVYSTYLGGSGEPVNIINSCMSAQFLPTRLWDGVDAIAVDAEGNAYVTGTAVSTDFPVTTGAYQTQNNGAANYVTNAFVSKLNPTGSALVYSTYLGGSGCTCPFNSSYAGDASLGMAVDSAGNAYVAGIAFSSDFPVTQGAFQTSNRFTYSYDGSNGGPNGFVTKLNPSGTALAYSTYLGGSGGFIYRTPDFWMYGGDQATGLAIDNLGNAYITGSTASADFPVTQNSYQATNNSPADTGYNAFVTELNSLGTAVVYSTYLGGNGSSPYSGSGTILIGDTASGLALDGSGNVYLTGTAESADFPVTSGVFQTTIQARGNTFAAKLNIGPTFTITGVSVTIKAGATTGNTSTITVTPGNGFTGSVALTAAVTSAPSGAQDPPTFSFGATSPVNITGPAAGTATLTITTTAASNCAQAHQMQRSIPWYGGGGAALACVLLFGIPVGRRNRRAALGMLVPLVTLALGLLACGGSGGSTCQATGTTPGTYVITVTGTAGATTAPGTVMLTVQ
jgi:Beta-propeller repeat